jgi:DNA modification methylase
MSAPTTSESTQDAARAHGSSLQRVLGRIVCGDNTEVLSGFPDACIDLVVTSPPYDDLRTYGGHSWNFEALAAQLVRVLKPGGVIVWVVADATVNGSESGTSMRQALHFQSLGLNLHDTMVYEKAGTGACGSNLAYWQAWEFMFVMAKGRPKTVNRIADVKNIRAGAVCTKGRIAADGTEKDARVRIVPEISVRTNLWRYQAGNNGDDRTDHPAVFPEGLAKDHIVSWSNPGDVVLDPFSGSGTTCKAAKELERLWCGIELNPKYCADSQRRLSQDVLQLETCAMRPNDPGERLPGQPKT